MNNNEKQNQSSQNPQNNAQTQTKKPQHRRVFSPEHHENKNKHGGKRGGDNKQSGHSLGKRPPRRHNNTPKAPKVAGKDFPEVAPGDVRIIPLGGVEEVGKNMAIIENKDDIFICDAGFQFSEQETPGIDFIIPNTQYLEDRKHKIRGLFITHGHLDHIGAIPFLMEKLGNPTIYARPLTNLMIKKRCEEFPQTPKINYVEVEPDQKLTIGSTTVKTFGVTHSIPDSMGISVETPHGNIVFTGDLKLDHKDGVPAEHEEKSFGRLGADKNLFLMADSTNAESPGWSIPEEQIYTNIETIIKEAQGRLIIGTFASQFARMIKIIDLCEKYGKKIVTEGRSIKSNIEIAQRAGLVTPKKDTIIPVQEVNNYPNDRVVVLATGAQGEEFAALMRMATQKHRHLALTSRDTILLSSSVIPGNEISVQHLKDALYRHGLKIIHYRVSDVHASGHGNQGELAWINEQVGAKFFMPGYGYHSMLRVHAEVAERSGVPRENIIIPDNGTIIDIHKGEEVNISKLKAPSWDIFVDGFSVGDKQQIVIRDRQMLTESGMFIVVVMLNTKNGRVKKSPDVISRGFVYLKENQALLKQARGITRKAVEEKAKEGKDIDFDAIKREVSDNLSRFLYQKTNKQPMVIPVILTTK